MQILTGHGGVNNIENGRKNAMSRRIGRKLILMNCLMIVNNLFICPAATGIPLKLINTVIQDRQTQIAPKFHW